MKKYLVILVVVAVIGFAYLRRSSFSPSLNFFAAPTPASSSSLPPLWQEISNKDNEIKLEKTVVSGLKPQITLKTYTIKEALTPAKYTDRLKAGARSALPSLKFDTDNRDSKENLYTAFLSGTYLNRKQKINILQRVYIKGEQVTVLTSSFVDTPSDEINGLLDKLAQEKSL